MKKLFVINWFSSTTHGEIKEFDKPSYKHSVKDFHYYGIVSASRDVINL